MKVIAPKVVEVVIATIIVMVVVVIVSLVILELVVVVVTPPTPGQEFGPSRNTLACILYSFIIISITI